MPGKKITMQYAVYLLIAVVLSLSTAVLSRKLNIV